MVESPESEPDYYAVLRVAPGATHAEIEQAYRRLAGSRANALWRPGRAARELALINAAYGVLGYPERRADYDRRRAGLGLADDGASRLEELPARSDTDDDAALMTYRPHRQRRLPRVQLGRPTGGSPLEAIIILLVVGLAIFVGSAVINRPLVDLSFILNIGETLGISARRRPAAVPSPSALVTPSPVPAITPTPDAPLGALPTSVVAQRFAGSQVSLSSTEPARRSDLTVTLKLLREGQPVANANVYLVARYRTVEERQPPGNNTVRTDEAGTATITFNIGDATPNYQVNLEVVALVEGQQVPFQASFTPR